MKASEIQKARIAEIENQADLMIKELKVTTLTSINEQGYPRTCLMTKVTNIIDSFEIRLESYYIFRGSFYR